jgi:cyclohexyl-isocyanide hydratase
MSPFNIGFVILPDLTQLDFTGPQQVLARLPTSAMHIVAKTKDPVPSDSGLRLLPTHTFENCPRLDLICIPGGNKRVVDALRDQETIEFVRQQASTARYVTSVSERSSSGLPGYSRGVAQRRIGRLRNSYRLSGPLMRGRA